jgi:hypothetical protein
VPRLRNLLSSLHLSEWLLSRTEHDIERTYVGLGEYRGQQGIAFNSVFWGIVLTKENLWDFLQREFIEEPAYELRSELELDCALYYLSVGYWRVHQDAIDDLHIHAHV